MRADFVVKFYTMLTNKIYILSPSFVELYLKMTKLCCFNRDNPYPQCSEGSFYQ